MDTSTSTADPYDWSVDEVIHAFCSPYGLLIRRYKTYDLTKIAKDLKDNDVNGEVLLSELPTGSYLKDDFGIRSIGQLKAFKEEIFKLRSKSQRWQQSPASVQEKNETESKQKLDQIASFFHHFNPTPATSVGNLALQQDSSPVVSGVTNFNALFSSSPNGSLQPSRTSESLPTSSIQAQHVKRQIIDQTPDDETRSGNQDADGQPKPKKRRIAPQLIQPRQESEVPPETSQHSEEGGVLAGSRPDNGEPGYLGLQSMPVNQIFYGETAVGKAVEHKEVSLHALEARALKRAGGFDGGLDPERFELEQDAQTVFNLDVSSVPQRNGRSLYLNNRMKHFLLASDALGPGRYVPANRKASKASGQRRREYTFGIEPYQQRILKYSKDPGSSSLTIFTDGEAKRERLRDWSELDSETAEAEDIYDHLEAKWADAAGNEPDLPAYGDSDSEDKFYGNSDDSEEEALEKPNASKRRLTHSEAMAIVKEEISLFMEAWRADKLPQLERQAYSIWKKSRRSRREDMRMCKNHLERLNDRLDRLSGDLAENQYDRADDLRKQCVSLHITLGDKAATEWKIGLLGKREPPPRLNSNKQVSASKSAQKRPVDLASDEEDLTDEEDYRFIDDPSEMSDNGQAQDAEMEDRDEGNDSPDSLVAGPHQPLGGLHQDLGDPHQEHPGGLQQHLGDSQKHPGGLQQHLEDPQKELGGLHQHLGDPRQKHMGGLHQDLEDSHPKHPGGLQQHLGDSQKHPGGLQQHLEDPQKDLGGLHASDLSTTVDSSSEIESNLVDSLMEPEQDDVVPLSSKVRYYSSDVGPDDTGTSEPSVKGLPGPSEIARLGRLSAPWINFICSKKLRAHILGLLAAFRRQHRWPCVIEVMKLKQSSEMIHPVWDALTKLQGHHTKLRHLSEDESEGLLQLTIWFVAWFCCFVPHPAKGIPISKLQETQEHGKEAFHKFWNRLEEVNLLYDKFKTKPNMLTYQPSADRFNKQPGEEGGKRASSSKSTAKKSVAKTKKGRLTESQGTSEWHTVAANRKRMAEKRVKDLQKDWHYGANGERKVYINAGSGKELIAVNDHISCHIKGHQIEGINFLWREAIEAREGSLLAHVMGLGKTMQCITFLVTIAEASRSEDQNIRAQIPKHLLRSQTLILCPPGLVQNWYDELLKWAPEPRGDNIGHIRLIDRDLQTKGARLLEIKEWVDNGGVLIIPYSILTPMVSNKLHSLTDEEHEFVQEALLKHPRIVIADEAQTFKNPTAQVSKVMKQFQTKTRIALTGSPLANNLAEYYQLLDWTSEGYLGTYTEFKDLFETPITTGLYVDASEIQQRHALTTLKILEEELSPKVLRADYSSMHGQMRGKSEFTFKVPPTDLQKQCYDLFIKAIRGNGTTNARQANILAWLDLLKLICNHPQCFADRLRGDSKPLTKPKAADKPGGEEEEEEQEEQEEQEEDGSPREFSQVEVIDKEVEEVSTQPVKHVGLTDSIIKDQLALLGQLSRKKLRSPQISYKMRLLTRILELSREAGEKVLICSQSITTLDYVQEYILGKYKSSRIDGSISTTQRQELVRNFNDSETEEVMLISTRAGGVGINLFGASRVVIIDESWNPMNEQQAIGRAYRIGQKKHVFVYRFIVAGSFEEELLNQATFKKQLANRVVDQKDTVRKATKRMGQYIRPLKEASQEDLKGFEGKDALVLDEILREQNENDERIILSMQEDNSFLEEEKETLTAEEEATVNEIQKLRKLRRTDPRAYHTKLEDVQRGGLQGTVAASVVAAFLGQPLRSYVPPSTLSGANQMTTAAPSAHIGVPNNQMGSTSTASRGRPSGLRVSNVKRDETRSRLSGSFEEKVRHKNSGQPAEFARTTEGRIFKLSGSVEEYDTEVLRMLYGMEDGTFREHFGKLKVAAELADKHHMISNSDDDHGEVTAASAADAIADGTSGEHFGKLKVAAKLADKHPEVTAASASAADEAQSPAVDSNDEQSAKERASRKTNTKPFRLDPIEVERAPLNETTEKDATGMNLLTNMDVDAMSEKSPTNLDADAMDADLPTNMDGSDDNRPNIRVKSELHARSQNSLHKARTPQTNFRQPPGHCSNHQGDSERMIPIVSLVSSDDDHNGETDSDELHARPNPTPRAPVANLASGTKSSQATPKKRDWNISSDEDTSDAPRPGSRSRRGRSGYRPRGHAPSSRGGGVPRGVLAPIEPSRAQDQGNSNVRQTFHGLPYSSTQPSNRFGGYQGLNDAYRSGADPSFSGKRG
ncbi:hypothetical protein MMC10_005181 [Thelotrema lepadinum]|nr:hypothetical protein [Thelotrema lepadinum]